MKQSSTNATVHRAPGSPTVDYQVVPQKTSRIIKVVIMVIKTIKNNINNSL